MIHLGRRTGRRVLEEIALLHRADDGMLRATTAWHMDGAELRDGPAASALAARLGRTAPGARAGSTRDADEPHGIRPVLAPGARRANR